MSPDVVSPRETPKTSPARWKRLLFPVLVTGLCMWAACSVAATGIAAFFEGHGDGAQALRWRAASPAALALEADNLVRNGEHAAVGDMARRAIERSSLRADALKTLALSAAAGGRIDAADRLMVRSGRLNPRDVEAQIWLFERAIAREDYRGAMLHADILMRRSFSARTPLAFTLSSLLGNDRARTPLVERLAMNPPWRRTFFTVVVRVGEGREVAALLRELRRTPSPVTDSESSPFFRRLVAEGRFREAKADFDALVEPQSSQSDLVYDGTFAGRPGPSPLNWYATSSSGGSARWKRDDGTALGSLLVRHDGFSSSGPLARQLIFLPPGPYGIAVRTRVVDPVADRRFSLQIACAAGQELVSLPLSGVPRSWASSHDRFSVPPTNCEAQWLQIVPVTIDRREMAEMSIDDIVVRRIASPSVQPGQRKALP